MTVKFLYQCILLYAMLPLVHYMHEFHMFIILAFLSSPDDDNIIIILLLLAKSDPSINKMPLFSKSLTADLWTFFSSNHDDSLITLYGFDQNASFGLLHQLFKPRLFGFLNCF